MPGLALPETVPGPESARGRVLGCSKRGREGREGAGSIAYLMRYYVELTDVYADAKCMRGRTLDPFAGTVSQSTVPERYKVHSFCIALLYAIATYARVISCTRARTHAAWHAHAIY